MTHLRGMLAVALLGMLTGGAVRGEQVSGPRELTQAAEIRTRLHKDHESKNSRIDVRVDHGIARLTGTVNTDSEKMNAGEVAMVEGIIAVQNQLDVETVSRKTFSDDALTAKIKARIAEHWMALIADISVTTNNGVVTLTGSVPSENARAEALQVARSADGVSRVESDLTIAPKK